MITVTGLTKEYASGKAVDHLDFVLQDKMVYGLLGRNGAGKTTTMNMMTGYIAATEGTIVIDGHDVFAEPEQARAMIGYLPEKPPLYADMTVKEYLHFAARLRGVSARAADAAVIDVMKRVSVMDMQDRLIKKLSKGFQQRVGRGGRLLRQHIQPCTGDRA